MLKFTLELQIIKEECDSASHERKTKVTAADTVELSLASQEK